jgi:hypothetical protein
LCLSPRALMELRGWLVETYNEEAPAEGEEDEEESRWERVKFCETCRDIVTIVSSLPLFSQKTHRAVVAAQSTASRWRAHYWYQ